MSFDHQPSALQIPLSMDTNSSSIEAQEREVINWLLNCHGFWHNFALIMPSVLFILYLAFRANKCYRKLLVGKSHIINSYYGIVWFVSLLNLAWCCLQTWECTPEKTLAWNLLSLFTTSGMLFLEVSLIALLLQGHYTRGLEALTRTFAVSALLVGLDIFLKGICVFAFGISLFVENDGNKNQTKWGFWTLQKLVLAGVYGVVLFMYHSNLRERLPARPAYHKYVTIMLGVNALALVACALTGSGFGFWLYDTLSICYHALYLPLIYKTFLADFFEEEDLNSENLYYSEMKDAGFFDEDWE